MAACEWSLPPVDCLWRPITNCAAPDERGLLSIPRHTRMPYLPLPHDSVTRAVLLEANTKPHARLIHNRPRSQADDDSASSRLQKQQLRLLPQSQRKSVMAMPYSVIRRPRPVHSRSFPSIFFSFTELSSDF
jgi:hypothetical protein